MLLEVAVYSLEAAIAAQEAGTNRIELCSAPAEGGLTPSAATLRLARKYIEIPLHVMIRPREGDFYYTEREFETMLLDVVAADIVGADGIVAGILMKNGTIDAEKMAMLVELAGKMTVTCHRAFDMTADPFEAMETLIGCGVKRILTSGGRQTAPEGLPAIKQLVTRSDGRIIIMPGGGINEGNITRLAEQTGVSEIHLSAKTFIPGLMEYRNPHVSMGGNVQIHEYNRLVPDSQAIRRIIASFDKTS
jgi:copper homeostasis protein